MKNRVLAFKDKKGDKGKVITIYDGTQESGDKSFDLLNTAFRVRNIDERTFHKYVRAMRREGYVPSAEYIASLDAAMLGIRDRDPIEDYKKGLAMEIASNEETIDNSVGQENKLENILKTLPQKPTN